MSDTLARILNTKSTVCSATMLYKDQLIVANNKGKHDHDEKILNKLKDTLSTNQMLENGIIRDLVNIKFQVLDENNKSGRHYSYDGRTVTCIDHASIFCFKPNNQKNIIKLQDKDASLQELKTVIRIVP